MSFHLGGGGRVNLAFQSTFDLECIFKTETAEVSAGTHQDTDWDFEEDEIWDLISLYMYAPALSEASSGTHTLEAWLDQGEDGIPMHIVQGEIAYGSDLLFKWNCWQGGATAQPSQQASQIAQIQMTNMSNMIPLNIRYSNDTNGVQDGDRKYAITYKKYRI